MTPPTINMIYSQIYKNTGLVDWLTYNYLLGMNMCWTFLKSAACSGYGLIWEIKVGQNNQYSSMSEFPIILFQI